MLKKLFVWFIVFALSFLLSNVFGLASQGVVFFYLHIGLGLAFFLLAIVALVIYGLAKGRSSEANGLSFLLVLEILIILFVTVLVTKIIAVIFAIDFYLAYQIMTFVMCLCANNKKNKS